jgi:hypothetical protein
MAYETLTFRPSKENKTLLAQLAKLAKQDNRNLNNYIETILLNHTQERGSFKAKKPSTERKSKK